VLNFGPALSIYLCAEPVDLRKSHDGLAALAQHALQRDPLSGALFVFRNKRADRVKLLYWDGDGYALWYKRLEAGTFRFPCAIDAARDVAISSADLTMLLAGVDLASVRRSKRFRLGA
jgi:transposase